MNTFKTPTGGQSANQMRAAFLACITKNPTVRNKTTGAIFRTLCTAAGITSNRGQ